METAEAETPMIVSTRVVPRSIAMDLLKVIMIFFVVLAHTFEGTIVAAPGFMEGDRYTGTWKGTSGDIRVPWRIFGDFWDDAQAI